MYLNLNIICCLGWTWKENDRPTFKALYQELCQLSNINEGLPYVQVKLLLMS